MFSQQHFFKLALWFLCFLTLLGVSAAQDEVEATTGLLSNPEAEVALELWLDKRYANGKDATYIIGESIEIGLKVSSSAYVYLYNIHSDGTVLQIYPNRYESTNFLTDESTVYFGIKGDHYHFKAAGPEGEDTFLAIASREKLSTESLANFLTNDGIFAVGYHSKESFVNNLRVLVEAVDNSSWVTQSVKINIRE